MKIINVIRIQCLVMHKMQLQIIDMLNMIKRKLKEEISTMNVLSRKKIENFILI